MKRLLSLVGILFLLVILWKGDYVEMLRGKGGFWDFAVYHQMVREVQRGVSPYQVEIMQTLGPPSVLIPFVPWSYLPLNWSVRLFTLVSLLTAGGVCWWLVHHFHPTRRFSWWLVYLTVLLSAFPTRFTFITGQLNVLALVPVTMVVLSKSEWLRGFAAALLTITKTFFLNSVVTRAYPRYWRFWLAFGLSTAIILLFFLPLITPAHYWQYLTERASTVILQPDRITSLAYYSQSLKTSFSRLGWVDHSLFLWLVVSLATGFITWRSRQLSTGLLWSTLVSPVVWQHYVVLFFPILVVVGHWAYQHSQKRWRYWWLAALVLWWVEFPWLHGFSITWWWGLVASHYAIGGWLLWWLTVQMSLELDRSEATKESDELEELSYTTATSQKERTKSRATHT